MPEINECKCSGYLVQAFISDIKAQAAKQGDADKEPRVLNLWADPTRDESTRSSDERAHAGHVYQLKPTAQIERGQNGSQTMVYPEALGNRRKITVKDQHLFLAEADWTPRDVVLRFRNLFGQSLYAQVKLFTHVLAQVYTREQWENAIMVVPRSQRKFAVGLAFEFRNHFLAFVSRDLLVQDLPASERFDIHREPLKFLEALVSEVHKRFSPRCQRDCLAVVKVRELLHGCGAYTVCEVFHRAGLPVTLTEHDLLDNGSRVARLVLAFYHIAAEGTEEILPWLEKYKYHHIIAVDKDHRNDFAKFLKVYGQDVTLTTKRQKELIMEIQGGNSCYDAFEPALVKRGLLFGGWSLGRLAFGRDHWTKFIALGLQQHADADMIATLKNNDNIDPLTAYYETCQATTGDHSTYLDLNRYTYLLDPADRLSAARMPTILYRGVWKGRRKKDMACGQLYLHDIDVFQADAIAKAKALTKTVIGGTQLYSVGPLDFCGVAKIVPAQGGGPPQVHVCEEDPRFGIYYQQKRSAAYKSSSATQKAKAKKGKAATRTRRTISVPRAKVLASLQLKSSTVVAVTTGVPSGEPRKRRRKLMGDELMLLEPKRFQGIV
ncbi:hypothetical protein BC835DRAFT_1421541 [Cytidiella melzeri]|nr:hypothetical protein BC835DRAFT_1421541 [Cytidiella melzeri]